MKIFSYIGCAALSMMALAACQKDKIENPGQYSKVFIAQAIDAPAQRDFIMADTLQLFSLELHLAVCLTKPKILH